jgi:hypothetical protein
MSIWKSWVERMRDTRDELARKAAKKAARAALDTAGKAAGSAGKAIERALFGDERVSAKKPEEAPAPDPFARVKAAEAERKERERADRQRAKERAAGEKKRDDDVDAELAAMKKKLGK